MSRIPYRFALQKSICYINNIVDNREIPLYYPIGEEQYEVILRRKTQKSSRVPTY